METVSVSEFKAKCLGMLERVRKTGQPLLITKRGTPIAQVLAPPPPKPDTTTFGCMAEGTEEFGDIVEPLPWEDWEVLR